MEVVSLCPRKRWWAGYVPSDFGSCFSVSQEMVVGRLYLSRVCSLPGEKARRPGSSPVLQSQCFSWPWPASVPLTTVVFPLGPFQQDGVGTEVPNDPERGSELRAEWKTTFHPGIHQTATCSLQRPEQQTGRKPAHVPSTDRVSSFSRLHCLYLGFSSTEGNTCRSRTRYLKVPIIFPPKSARLGADMLKWHKNSVMLATTEICSGA